MHDTAGNWRAVTASRSNGYENGSTTKEEQTRFVQQLDEVQMILQVQECELRDSSPGGKDDKVSAVTVARGRAFENCLT
ncbi:hypothetical protein E2C01_094262 [Portunus trituberculatus]|uniref:Uncharacterized protein n=1 Tax=Portunus trituberculatus TaxID=210409 RepID=A0A5B7JX46_PORTR|nr:hypothetical protein [Portunus trituberculatus]